MSVRTHGRTRTGWLRHLSRRGVLRAAFGAGVVSGTAGALAPIVNAEGIADGDRTGAAGPLPELREVFDEMYRGRRIRGVESAGGVEITVDGRPLHVMRRADGGYLSMVNHYESFPTPLAVARGAVDELGTAQLSLTSMQQF
ncbi:tyrosinase cofactor [Streptomyces sp. NBC_01387]|uniref:tyrosinase cofactor n=1 Tax=unclassified Streptomyces TaxID=2593676 RepID=UPI0020257AD9|nr:MULTISPECIES: tyrosinase cofactor [unclassified Streptomyces]WSC21347.1 tyrosinase cofactor [Streptomyces sp. NBC_01766]